MVSEEDAMDLFTLNFTNDKPLYEQLYQYIKANIQAKNLKPNDKLPSKRKLSQHLSISQNTVQSAYNQLLDEGYLYAKERSGYFVEEINWFLSNPEENHPHQNQKDKPLKKTSIQYDFDFNSIDLNAFPSKELLKAYRESMDDLTIFSNAGDSQGFYPLRQSISKYLFSSRGVQTRPENIIISSGTEFSYTLILNLLKKETIYGIENPGYSKVELIMKENQQKHFPMPVGKAGIEVQDLLKYDINCVTVSPSHQFPTGILYPISRRYELLKWASEHSSWIIEDDYDSEFRYSGKPIPAFKGLDIHDRVIYLGSFSKSFTPALRISYIVLPEELLSRYNQVSKYLICPTPVLTQKSFHNLMNSGAFTKHLNRMRTLYGKKREYLIDLLNETGFPISFQGTESGLHLHIKIDAPVQENKLVQLAEKEGVRIYGISDYYYNQKKDTDSAELLLGYSNLSKKEIEIAVRKLVSAWENYI